MREKKKFLCLALIILFGFYLRVQHLHNGALTFGYDQGRDAFIAEQILGGDLKIIGPPASVPGMYHGVLYYYILAVGYWLGNGSPILATYWMAGLNAVLGGLVVFFLAKSISKDIKVGLLASLLWAVSFEANQYATWLSNPTIGEWSVPLIYLGLWLMLDKKKRIWAGWVTGTALGISIQAEIFLAYHLLPVGLWILLDRKKMSKKMLSGLVASGVISLLPMIIAEFKFGWTTLKGMRQIGSLDSLSHGVDRLGFGNYLLLYLNQIGRTFSNNLLPYNVGHGGFLGLLIIFGLVVLGLRNKKRQVLKQEWFLLSILLSHASVVSLGGSGTPFIMVGIGAGIAVTVAVLFFRFYKQQPAVLGLILVLIVLSNIWTNFSRGDEGQIIFSIQKDMLLSKELKAIDYTYKKSDGNNFSINTLTSPLWINTTWSYLYNWYGKNKYGYLPEWHGRDQIGRLGNNLKKTDDETRNYFFIIEPERGIPEGWFRREKLTESGRAYLNLVEQKNWGDVVVEKRVKKI